jgi:hypothetical protein
MLASFPLVPVMFLLLTGRWASEGDEHALAVDGVRA